MADQQNVGQSFIDSKEQKCLNQLVTKALVLLFILGLFHFNTNGQDYTLEQCIDYATKNNSQIKIAQHDVSIAGMKIKEQVGTMLPKVDGSATYTNNLKLATTLIPASFMGAGEAYYEVHMGTKHNLSVGVSASQELLNPTFKSSFKKAKANKKLSEQTIQQTKEQVVYNISKIYYQALIIQKQTMVLKATLSASEKSLSLTEQKYKGGIAKKIDVDKIQVNTNNTRTHLQQNELSYNQAINTLKYYMGYPVDSLLVLGDTSLESVFNEKKLYVFGDFNIENKIDYRIQETQVDIQELEKKKNVSAYFPSLSVFAAYNYNAMGEEFNFFNSDASWYNSSNIGLSLKVPIFSGFQRKQKVSQARVNISKAKENLQLTEQAIKVDISNYEISYRNALENIHDQKLNLDLAKNVYNDTYLQYQQGIGTSLDLVQAENSLNESQNNYFNKLLDLYVARLDLEQSKGNLMNFINNKK